MILGTAAYMSPEQARGKPVDKRTDIWSFGCVLYESLTGKKAFAGETTSDLVAAILSQEPRWELLPAETPAPVRELLARCLRKDPHKRLRDIGDARLQLEEPESGSGIAEAAAPAKTLAKRRVTYIAAAWLLAGLAAGALVSALLWRRPPAPVRVTRFTIHTGPGETLSNKGVSGPFFSPDGSRLAYAVQKAGAREVRLRSFDEFQSRAVAGTEGAAAPTFSPDGESLVFYMVGKWKKVTLSGGPPVTLFDAPLGGAALAAWTPDDTLVYGVYPASMWRVPLTGGNPQEVPVVDPKKNERWGGSPRFLPGTNTVTYNFRTRDVDSFDDYSIATYSFDTGTRKTLIEGGREAKYPPSGHLVYLRAATLYAVPFDLGRLAVTGKPTKVLEGVFQSEVADTALFDVSNNGSLAYAPGTTVGDTRRLVWVDRQGKAAPLPLPPRAYLHPRLSPDGRQLAVETEGPNHNIFLYDLERGAFTKMTFDGSSHSPLWTPDGKRLTYRVGMPQPFTIWWMPADRSGPGEQLKIEGQQQGAESWSPDGRAVAFTRRKRVTSSGGDIFVAELADGKARPICQTRFDEGGPRFSRDGRWIAYSCNESGRNEVYVQPYPGPGPKMQVSTEGGNDAVWAHNSRDLFYRNGDDMMVVSVSTKPVFRPGKPRVLWSGRYNQGLNSMCGAPGPGSANYDVSSDDQRFLMVQESETDVPATEIRVVLNWAEELKKLGSPAEK
ncbi:MAG: PD40 domain-containing protein [Acidobacteria bacterium]|nr:PD40 domain-containing protein [Acidobacteriota bacterium]